MALGNFIKKLIELDVLWGTRSKKLAGINDANNFSNEAVTMTAGSNTISFDSLITVPSYFKVDQYFRVVGGSNDGALLQVKTISGNTLEVYENINSDSGTRTVDARLWVVHNDESISKSSSTGSTIFNVNNRNTTGVPGDASELALRFAEHYHDDTSTTIDDIGELISTEYNQLGCKSKVKVDCCDDDLYVELGPQLIFNRDGNPIRQRYNSSGDPC